MNRSTNVAGQTFHVVDPERVAADVAEQDVVEEHADPVEHETLAKADLQRLTPQQQVPLDSAEGVAEREEQDRHGEETDVGGGEGVAEALEIGL